MKIPCLDFLLRFRSDLGFEVQRMGRVQAGEVLDLAKLTLGTRVEY
jgi:hypothetical protein